MLTLEPIGIVRSSLMTKVEAARQPGVTAGVAARIELLPARNFEHALRDLDRWELIWVLFWFHLNAGWRPKVLPPRSTTGRKGVFATRSPHRPNPLGLSVVRLARIEGLTLHICDSDMLDGTPVLDLKPYVAYTDSHPNAAAGWLEEAGGFQTGNRPLDPVPAFTVEFDPLAAEQAAWIEAHVGLALRERIESTLKLGPEPHPYRRIKRIASGMQLAIKEWRVVFATADRRVRVIEILSGFRASQLSPENAHPLVGPHRQFTALWPGNPGAS